MLFYTILIYVNSGTWLFRLTYIMCNFSSCKMVSRAYKNSLLKTNFYWTLSKFIFKQPYNVNGIYVCRDKQLQGHIEWFYVDSNIHLVWVLTCYNAVAYSVTMSGTCYLLRISRVYSNCNIKQAQLVLFFRKLRTKTTY